MRRPFVIAGARPAAACFAFASAAALLLSGCSGGSSSPTMPGLGQLPGGTAPNAATRVAPATSHGPSYRSAVLATNPEAYFPFDTAVEGSIVGGYKTTLNGGASVVSGGPILTEKTDSSLKLIGNPQFAGTNFKGGLPGTGSMIAWVNLSTLPSAANTFFYVSGESQSGNDFDLQFQTDNKLYFYTGGGENTVYTPPASSLVGKWNMIAVTYVGGSSGSRNIYWNGTLAAPFSGSVNATPKTNEFHVGESTVFPGRYFRGNLADVTVYNRALTAQEIATIFQASGQPSTSPSPTPMPSMSPTPMPSMTPTPKPTMTPTPKPTMTPTPKPTMTPTPKPTMTPTSGPLSLYVSNIGNSSITVYPLTASGNATPMRTIITQNSGNGAGNTGVAVDRKGTLYVSDPNYPPSFISTIAIYAPGANGNAPPSKTIQGGNTGLNGPQGLVLDASNNLYVGNINGHSVTVYAPGASGNATPIRTLAGSKTMLDFNGGGPMGLALDGSANLGVNVNNNNSCAGMIVLGFAPGTNGNTAPTRALGGNCDPNVPYGAAFGPSGKLYVAATNNNAIFIYSKTAHGSGPPTTTISGSNTLINQPTGVAFDRSGDLYVANTGYSSANTITVYAPGATGNAKPIKTISGSNTGLNVPTYIAIGP